MNNSNIHIRIQRNAKSEVRLGVSYRADISNGVYYAGSSKASIKAISSTVEWTIDEGSYSASNNNGDVWVATDNNAGQAFARRYKTVDGAPVLQATAALRRNIFGSDYDTGQVQSLTMLHDGGCVFLAYVVRRNSGAYLLCCYNPDGTERWTQAFGNTPGGSSFGIQFQWVTSDINGKIYMLQEDTSSSIYAKLYALDVTDGSIPVATRVYNVRDYDGGGNASLAGFGAQVYDAPTNSLYCLVRGYLPTVVYLIKVNLNNNAVTNFTIPSSTSFSFKNPITVTADKVYIGYETNNGDSFASIDKDLTNFEIIKSYSANDNMQSLGSSSEGKVYISLTDYTLSDYLTRISLYSPVTGSIDSLTTLSGFASSVDVHPGVIFRGATPL